MDSAGGSVFEHSRTSSECSDSDGSDSQHSNSDAQSLYSEEDCQEMVKHILQHENPTRITIKLHVTENQFSEWESVSFFRHKNLFLNCHIYKIRLNNI